MELVNDEVLYAAPVLVLGTLQVHGSKKDQGQGLPDSLVVDVRVTLFSHA